MTRTRGHALKQCGRALLWLLVLVLLARGAASLVGTGAPRATATAVTERATPAVPDPVRAFAIAFARDYLAYDPARPDRSEQLRDYATTEIAQAIVPDRPPDAPKVGVDALSVSGAVANQHRYLVTVNVRVSTRDRPVWRQLGVSVADVPGGGLVVDELPSLVAAPARGDLPQGEPPGEALSDPQITGMLERFFSDYLAGDAAAIASGPAAPGVRLGATTGGLVFQDLTGLRALPGAPRGEQDATVSVRAKDRTSHATFGLHYRLRLRHGDRWYVAEINPREGGTP